MMLEYFGCDFKSTLVNRAHDLSVGAAENMQGNDLDTPTYTAAYDLSYRLSNSPADKHHNSIYLAR